jgi:hypothetical protein
MMLNDLAEFGAEAERVFPSKFPRQHGGSRREGSTPAVGLIEHLIEIYAAVRRQYPESGPALAFNARLKRFVRAGLAFAVSAPPEVIEDGRRHQYFEARFLEKDLPDPSRITDHAIRGAFNRCSLHKSRRRKT